MQNVDRMVLAELQKGSGHPHQRLTKLPGLPDSASRSRRHLVCEKSNAGSVISRRRERCRVPPTSVVA